MVFVIQGKKLILSMKKIILVLVIAVLGFSTQAFCQTDTVKLSKQYADVTKDIADLQVKLQDAQSKLPTQEAKAQSAKQQPGTKCHRCGL